MRLIFFFFENTPNLTEILETQEKIKKKCSISEISALKLVAIICPDSNENTSGRQSMC